MRIHENQWKSMRIHENPWESMKIHENPWEFIKYGRALRARPYLINFNGFSWIFIDSHWFSLICIDFNCFFVVFWMIFDMLSLHLWFRTHGIQDTQLFLWTGGATQSAGRRGGGPPCRLRRAASIGPRNSQVAEKIRSEKFTSCWENSVWEIHR